MFRRLSVRDHRIPAFTLIELLVVISIISLLISILLPSLSRAREQAKSLHCKARLHEFGTAIATYENMFGDVLPVALWFPDPEGLDTESDESFDPLAPEIQYGWTELLFAHAYREPVRLPISFPVQRNIDGDRWEKYFICEASTERDVSSGHYRVYLPAWSGGYAVETDNAYGVSTQANPLRAARRDAVRPKLPLIGDANEFSERGDGVGDDDCSYIDAGEANYAGSDGGFNGNRFSDRHYGGTNYLFQDLHATWSTRLREQLARDFDLNGVVDIAEEP